MNLLKKKPGSISRLVIGTSLIALFVLVVVPFLFNRLTPHLYSGSVFQDSVPAPPMDGLVLHTGDKVDLDEFAGDVVVVYYGYTNCPDICPTTLTDVATAIDNLGSKGERVTLLMVTIDPERDDLAYTGEYVQFFHENFYGVGGSLDDITLAATRYGVYFAKTDLAPDGSYEMEHTPSLLGIDAEGTLRIIWPPGISPSNLTSDLDALLG